MTRQIATGRAGKAYEIVGDYRSRIVLIVDNEPQAGGLSTMEYARKLADTIDQAHFMLEGSGAMPPGMTWTTYPDDRLRR